MLTGEILNTLFKRSGVSLDNEALTALQAIKEVATLDIPDEVANKLLEKGMSYNEAIANKEVKNHLKATTLKGLDAQIDRIAEQYNLSEEHRSLLGAESNSFERTAKAFAYLSAMKDKAIEEAKNAKGPKDASEHLAKIDALNAQILQQRTEHENAINQKAQELNDFKLRTEHLNTFGNYDWAKNDMLEPSEVRAMGVKRADDAIPEQGLKLHMNGNGLELLTSDGDPYYKDNQKVSYTDFVNSTLSNTKLLKKSEPTTPTPAPAPVPSGGGGGEDWSSFYKKQVPTVPKH